MSSEQADCTLCSRLLTMNRRVFAPLLAAAGLSAAVLAAPAPARKSALPFIEDDYPRALAEARSKKLPIFVEAWAPW
jgi:hypothetical protein